MIYPEFFKRANYLLPIPPKLLIPCTLGSGMLPGAHWTAQVQTPLESSVPWPVVNPEEEEEESVETDEDEVSEEEVDEVPETMVEVDPLPSCWMASCWNSTKVFSTVGLMAKVIPRPQWLSGVC